MGVFSNVDGFDKARLIARLPVAFAKYSHEIFNNYLMPVAKATPDWPSLVFLYLGLIDKTRVRLRGGKRMALGKSGIRALLLEIKRAPVIPEGEEPKHLRIYNIVDVKGKTVIDIGAYNGDSALYFIRHGAKRVIGFEPVRSLYLMGVKNVADSRMSGRIRMVNKAVLPGNGRSASNFSLGLGLDETKSSVSLNSLIKTFGLKGAVLKLDSEGSEYSILRRLTRKEAAAFDEIAVRYYKGYRNIESKLRSLGYETVHTKPAFSFANMFRTFVARGIVHAKRRN
jgi:FkbM family methyltransferase